MAGKRGKGVKMEKIREVFRLALNNKMSYREIARSCNISHVSVGNYLDRLGHDITYSQIDALADEQLRQLLQRSHVNIKDKERTLPDWQLIHQELKKKGVTRRLLWQEYKEEHPDGYQLTQFYELYNQWRKRLNPSMRQTHKAGEKLFVDYAGMTVSIKDKMTGKIKEAQIFVAVLGASNYTYADASWSQNLPNWIESHIRAFEFFEGVPKVVVPDNLKSGVSAVCRYEPDINKSYLDMAIHYGVAIIPARVRKPKDKAKAEVGVQIVERWILAALRKETFFSLHQLNHRIRELLIDLNQRPMQRLKESRLTLFKSLDKPELMALAQTRYEFAQWKKAKVNIDYHIELDRHYYSVPYKLIHEEVLIRFTTKMVEIFYRNRRVASHLRNSSIGRHTTINEHMPINHREYQEWSPSKILNWASEVGEATKKVVERIMNQRKYPEQGYRSCLGILRLGKKYTNQRLEAACHRALIFDGYQYRSIKLILEKGLDREVFQSKPEENEIKHPNVRGGEYFH